MGEIKNPFSEDFDDKGNPLYQFTPPVHYTPYEVEAGNQIVNILNNPNLTETEKKDAVWQVLKGGSG